MNCNTPTIAVRRAGINPATGHCYKPHTFIRYRSDRQFLRDYFSLQHSVGKCEVLREVVSTDLLDNSESVTYEKIWSDNQEVLIIPCGKCLLCGLSKRCEWTCRCINEFRSAGGGCFLTLTCSDDSLLRTFPGGNLAYRPWQLFAKRLRKSGRMIDLSTGKPTSNFRFFMCGEYGEHTMRPHYHAVLFGVDFPDKKFVGRSKSGLPLYGSALLDDLRFDKSGNEIFGPVSNVAELSVHDIAYTCGYVEKKLCSLDPLYYEKLGLEPEFCRMSRRPGIGNAWLQKYHGDVWRLYQDQLLSDRVWASPDHGYKVPRYYNQVAKNTPLLPYGDYDKIVSLRKSRSLAKSLDPVWLAESLRRAHARHDIQLHRLKDVKAPRDF